MQRVVVAIVAKRVDGEFMVFTHSGKKNTGILLRDWVVEVEKRGAGEILLTSIDRVGTKSGYDTEMIRFVRPLTTLPIIASGGAGKMEHFLEAFLAGADKVSINTAAVENPSLITQIAQTFGSQAVVVAIVAKRVDGEFMVFTHSGKKNTGILLRDWVVEVEKRGAGEILLTSIDRVGTKSGYDTEMIRFVRPLTTLPIIASGGAGKMEHFLEAFLAGADKVSINTAAVENPSLITQIAQTFGSLEHHHHHH
uniref:Imidazole glycerol phosphate synthase subunit HisF n=1 Tax=Thermotoga maritima (strain ATCC 43589 / DSM 3109 / JCM 10099 / NBRC 100826 / MSB8) TaxID=243274 RepID=UPI0003AFF95D|nr:Chain A, Imidazole glycerol phosphate synthase subunit HisF [Thermotoga maritima MSB8]4FX7_B Chain B, Imidazole glycerol phosphate synthase subunit HisF [Thermotoga maritima MSB8]4FX7_C Chain C, Imidazole glycerol phosphate synthase subunit HisF [Thermotoga maritima MSB8]4FX7_D Chain D, Imidazole glycerol phosphate synthase subunit HisF [Thermotoga maritima MSB8]